MADGVRAVFLGTPEFALPTLRRLHARGVVQLVVSQPDRPAGRRGVDRTPAVITLARELGLPTMQPANPNDAPSLERMRAAQPDVLVVVAYGRLLRRPLLELAPAGVVNLHPSLLPEYRGASPIQAAIHDGRTRTGVTLMRMDAGLDTGPVIAAREMSIGPHDTSPALHDRLADAGAELLDEMLDPWVAGRVTTQPQDPEAATLTRPLERADAELDLRRPAQEIYDQWRAFQPWPGAFAVVDGQRVVITAMDQPLAEGRPVGHASLDGDSLLVGCGSGALRLTGLQPEGRKAMSARAFANGYSALLRATWGDRLPAHRPPLTRPAS
ncbi:MAG: methionyl-tRNA formyltransferase [Chloroflexi bacterium]|nr:methionyl-tRNA formyltransferase [Chloroflexota bacterium]